MEIIFAGKRHSPGGNRYCHASTGNIIVAIAGFILLASMVMGFTSHEYQEKQPPIRIMMLGDSITHGTRHRDSYRYYLWKSLVDADIIFDFVGSLSENHGGNPEWADYKGRAFDPDHEGHQAWRAENILRGVSSQRTNNLNVWLEEYTPDIALIHLGTNDIFLGQSHESTVEELDQIIRILRADNPYVVILLAQLIPSNLRGTVMPIEDLNMRINGIAEEMSQPGSPVLLVNHYTGFSIETDTYDGVHPNKRGAEKMAARWFEALKPVIAERFPMHIPSA
jgi:lysophospholipase L1-like esterase